jgi:hypothetical protein
VANIRQYLKSELYKAFATVRENMLRKMSRNAAKIAHVVSKFRLFQEVKFADVVSLKTFFKNLILKYVKYATLLKYVTDI